MQNTSDILCFKEANIRENDGSKMFAIDGSCCSKINRRHQTASDVLNVGYLKITEENPEIQEIPPSSKDVSKTPETIEVPKEVPDLDEAEAEIEKPEFKLEYRDFSNGSDMKRNPTTGVGFEDEKHDTRRHFVGATSDVDGEVKTENGEVFKSEYRDYSNASDMKRNPTTGVGFEAEEKHDSRRHYVEVRADISEEEAKNIKNAEFQSEYRGYLNSSDMKRNPVTGVGIEDEKHNSRRHYGQTTGSWLW